MFDTLIAPSINLIHSSPPAKYSQNASDDLLMARLVVKGQPFGTLLCNFQIFFYPQIPSSNRERGAKLVQITKAIALERKRRGEKVNTHPPS